jgi:hypothetical protein
MLKESIQRTCERNKVSVLNPEEIDDIKKTAQRARRVYSKLSPLKVLVACFDHNLG